MLFIIYMHKNKINGKVYIGQTCQKPEDRWKNGAGYKSSPHFYNAIQKYGWENFEHIILEQGEWTIDEANQKEMFYIDFYQSTNREKGYNTQKGGHYNETPVGTDGAVKWMKEHPEFGLARAADMLKWQAEHPEEALAFRLQNAKKAAEARRKPVRCIETGIVYESASEAARNIPKTSQSKICMVCRGQRNTCGGFHWEYVNIESKEKEK